MSRMVVNPYSVVPSVSNKLFGWGPNANGEVGVGSTADVLVPTQIGTNDDWVMVSAGQNFSAGIRGNGELYTWGMAAGGRLGNGTNTPNVLSPTRVGTDTGWQMVCAGVNHCLAIRDGKLFSWGAQTLGCLGNGTANGTETLTPTQIGSDTDWQYVAAGRYYSLAVKGGKLFAWGDGQYYRLGINSEAAKSTPTQVGTDTDWVKVGTGNDSSIFYKSSTATTAGSNSQGKLGAILSTPSLILGTQTLNPGNITVLAPTNAYRIVNGELFSTGGASLGYLGNGTSSPNKGGFTKVGTATDWQQVSYGMGIRSGQLYTWGAAAGGLLGNGTTTPNVTSPTLINSDTNWKKFAEGGCLTHRLAIKG